MKVTEVSAVVRYSAEAKGAWRSVEVGATATLTSSDETLESAQGELYQRLRQQLKTLWANGKAEAYVSTQVEPPPPAKTHWCSEHDQEFKRHEKDGNVWYSHRQGSGWCNEAKK
jgi:hypothetical protein